MTDQDQIKSAQRGHPPTRKDADAPDWYLEMLGVRPEAPPPQQGTRSRSTDMTFVLEAPPASVSTPTPLEPLTPPSRPVRHDLTEQPPDLVDWTPQELAPQMRSRRRFPWGWLITLLILTAGVVTALVIVPTIVKNQAAEEAENYRTVLLAMQATLADTQQTMIETTRPGTTGTELFDLVALLGHLDATSTEVTARASRPLPETLPLLSREPLQELEPTRSRMLQHGSVSQVIVRRLADTITYRTKLDDILVYPSLPVRADPSQIAPVEAALAETLASSAAVLSELPLDPAFDSHRNAAADAVEHYDNWRRHYLDALRARNINATTALIGESNQLRTALFADLSQALAIVRAEVDVAIVELNNDINATMAAIPR